LRPRPLAGRGWNGWGRAGFGMVGVSAPSRNRLGRGALIATILVACFVGVLGGAVGGAAGAMWVIETMASPRISPTAKNAVVAYEAMPKEGARPVDIAGLTRTGTPLHPCLIDFLRDQEAVIARPIGATFASIPISRMTRISSTSWPSRAARSGSHAETTSTSTSPTRPT